MANNGRFEYTIGFKTDNSGLNQARKALQELQNITVKTPGFENMADDLQLAKKYASELEGALSRSFNVKLKTTDVTKLRNELSQMDLKEIYRGLSAIGPKGEEVFNRMATQAMKTNLQIKQGNTLLERFGRTLYRNIEWMLAGNLVNTITGVFQRAYGFTKNLDSSLNDIRIVTGKSADEMARFGEEAQKTAAALGKGTTDITNASLIFYQQGLDTAEVNARTEVATKLANVTKQSTDVTADQLTAVWNGYKATNDELERYADIMTAVAASTASSSSELSGAISKVASVANTTGVDMEQLTAMMSTVISVTRESPETVGTAFKTIFARINDLVEDGTDEFGVSLGRVSSHLQAMGIEILNQDGSLKDLGNTLSDVGNRWNEYSREQQIAIAEQIGGKRQWNQVIALFDNWDKYADALDVAKNSTGELQRQQDIYAESTAYHLQQVKTAWEGVYGQMMSSDDINKVADFFTDVLKKVETFLESIGGIGPVLQMVAGYMLQAFGPKIGQQMANTINNLRIMKDNASQIAAQKDLTRMLGSVEDNALMQKLVGQHQQILKYKNLMTDADRQEYEEYLDQTVALKAKEDQIKKEIKDTEDLLAQRKALSEEYQKSGRDLSGGGFSTETLRRGQDDVETYLKNQTVETGIGKVQLGVVKYSVDQNMANDRAAELSKWAADIENNLQSGTRSEEATKQLEKLSNALKNVSKDFKDAADAEEINLGSLTTHEAAVEKTAQTLKKLGIPIQQLLRDGEETSLFWDRNRDVLMKSNETIEHYNAAIKQMAEDGALTIEQVNGLNEKLTKLNELDVTDPGHLADYKNIIESIDADLKKFATQAQGDLKQIGEAIESNTTTKLKNTQAGLESWGDSFNQQLNKLNIEAFFNKLTQLANLTSQLSMTFTQISNIKSIVSDESLKESEKMSKIISSLLFTVPMFTNVMKGLYSSTLQEAVAKKKANLEEAQSLINKAQLDIAEKKQIARQTEMKAIEAQRSAQRKKAIAEEEVFLSQLQFGTVENQLAATTVAAKAVAEAEDAKETAAAAVAADKKAKKALKEAVANKAAAKSIQDANSGLKGIGQVFSSISAGTLVIGAIVVAIAALVYGIHKVKEAQEEAEEASNRALEASQKYRESIDELTKTAQNNRESFRKWEDIWQGWRDGKKAIDEVKSSMEDLAEQAGISEDSTYKRLLRIAEYTNDYSDLEAYLNKIISQQESIERNAHAQKAQSYEEDLSLLRSNYKGNTAIYDGYTNYKNVLQKQENEEKLDEADNVVLNYWRRKQTTYNSLNNIVPGIVQDQEDLNQYVIDLTQLNAQQIDALNKQQEKLKEGVESGRYDKEIVDTILEYTNSIAGTAGMATQEYIQQTLSEATKALPTTLADQSDNTVSSAIDRALNRVLKEQNLEGIPEEEKQKYKDQIIQNYIDMFPDSQEVLTRLNMRDDIKNQLNNVISDYWNTNDNELSQNQHFTELTDQSLVNLQHRLEQAGQNLTDYNWSLITKNRDMMRILSETNGNITEEQIHILSQYKTEVGKTIQDLIQDYNALSDTADNVTKGIEKGTLSDRNINKDKEFQAVMAEDVQEELKKVYSKNSEITKAIEILNDKNISVSSEKWKNAWKAYADAIKNAQIDKAIGDVQKKVEDFGNDAIKNVKADQLLNDIENVLGSVDAVNIEIKAHIDDSVNEIFSDMSNLTEASQLISDGFVVAQDKLQKLVEAFEDSSFNILQNATVLKDGTIQLSQETVNQVIEEKKKEITQDIQNRIEKLKIENIILEDEKRNKEEMLETANKMAAGKFKTEEELQEQVNNLITTSQNLQIDSQVQAAIEEDQLRSDQFDKIAQYYHDIEKGAKSHYQKLQQLAEDASTEIYSVEELKTFKTTTESFTSNKYYVPGVGEVESNLRMINQEKEFGKRLAASLRASIAQDEKGIEENNRRIQLLTSEAELWSQSLDQVGIAKDKNTKATKDNTSATKDNAAAQAQLLEILNEEIDAYHDINIEIKQLETQLSRLQKQQSKLTSDALLKNLQEQLDILEKQNDAYLRKYDIMSMESAAVRTSLADQGVEFNDDGTISNYAAIIQQKMQYVQDLQSQYNNMSKEEQDGFKDTVEQAKKDYENFKKAITDYDSLITEKIPELQDKIQEISDKEIEIQISKAKMKVQAILDDQDLKRTEIEFKKKLARLKDDDILGNLTVNLEVMATYTADNGSLIALQQEVDRLTQVKADMDAGIFFSSEYGDNRAKLEEDLKAYSDQLRQQKEAVIGLRDAIQDAYVSALDQVNEKLDEQKEKYQQISDMLEKQINLYQIRFGDNTFDAISGLMEHQTDLAQKQYNVSLKQLDIFKKEYEKLLEQDPNEELEITQQAKKHFEEVNTKVYEDLVSLFEARQKQYENAVKAFFEIFNRQLTGGKDLDYVKDSWDRLNADAEDYYDAVNGAYEINKLRNQIEKDINKSTDPNVQRQLTNFLNQQVAALEKKDKLSKYDLERANAMYDLEVKRAAFQEAQQNKSKMRLRRDSQGNYSYQFVSDEQQVADTMQELADAQNKLYNVDTDALKNNNDKILKIIEDYQNAMIDSTNKTDEERAEIAKYYEQQLTNAIAEHQDIRNNLLESGLDAYAQKMGMTTEEVKRLSKEQKDAILSDIVPAWNSAIETMVQNMGGEDGIAAMFASTYDSLADIRRNFFDDLDDYADAAGIDLENIQTAADRHNGRS